MTSQQLGITFSSLLCEGKSQARDGYGMAVCSWASQCVNSVVVILRVICTLVLVIHAVKLQCNKMSMGLIN